MKKLATLLIHFLMFFLLTIISQVGGIIYIGSMYLSGRLKWNRLKSWALFVVVYLITCIGFLPFVTPSFHRHPLPLSGPLKPGNYLTVLLNRHYVSPEVRNVLISVSKKIDQEFPGTKTNYLDANFPFFDWFPLLPHLSHNDGKKVDLAFYYSDNDTKKLTNSIGSWLGYGAYDAPKRGEPNFTKQCKKQGFWKYDITSFLTPQGASDKLEVEIARTRQLISLLAKHPKTSKIFIEPHLKSRWELDNYDKVRFQGCHAVRHDDHIHWQIK